MLVTPCHECLAGGCYQPALLRGSSSRTPRAPRVAISHSFIRCRSPPKASTLPLHRFRWQYVNDLSITSEAHMLKLSPLAKRSRKNPISTRFPMIWVLRDYIPFVDMADILPEKALESGSEDSGSQREEIFERPTGLKGIYYHPYFQVTMLGFVCFMCPGMFNALGGIGGGGQVNTTAQSNAATATYSTFAFFAFFSGFVLLFYAMCANN